VKQRNDFSIRSQLFAIGTDWVKRNAGSILIIGAVIGMILVLTYGLITLEPTEEQLWREGDAYGVPR
jgi:hypothetical protein